MASSSQANDMKKLNVVERDPSGRYVRYDEFVGEGQYKTVYKGYDVLTGIEVAWSKTRLSEDEIVLSPRTLKGLFLEAELLMSLRHENILRCYKAWFEDDKYIHMITELCSSGNLIEYCKKHNLEDNRAIKHWTRQIVRGLDYLHRLSPPIIHRDVKCENIFVNGNTGIIKIGNLGLAKILDMGPAYSLVGTPAFWAPEMLKGTYNQLVDIYSLGMSLLQLVTGEVPYSECISKHHHQAMVICSIKPAAFFKLTDPEVKSFIERCLQNHEIRPIALDLLNDRFLAQSDSESLTAGGNSSLRGSLPAGLVMEIISDVRIYQLRGKFMDNNYGGIMILRIFQCRNLLNTITFQFNLKRDTTQSLLAEMIRDVGLSLGEAVMVGRLLKEMVTGLLLPYREYLSKLGNEPAEQVSNPQQLTETLGGQGAGWKRGK